MRLSRVFLHLLILATSTIWGLFLAYKHLWLRGYYIKVETIHISGVIYSCRFYYSPSLVFILIVLLPAIVLLALYPFFRKPVLVKSAIALGLTTLSVVLLSLKDPRWPLWTLLPVSTGIGLLVGKGKVEKTLLSIEGFAYGFIVLFLILGELAVSC